MNLLQKHFLDFTQTLNQQQKDFNNFKNSIIVFSKNKASFNQIVYFSKNIQSLLENNHSLSGQKIDKIFPKFRHELQSLILEPKILNQSNFYDLLGNNDEDFIYVKF